MAAEPPIGRDPTASARLLDAASEVDRRAERARQRVDELEQTLTELAAALASHEATVTEQRGPAAAPAAPVAAALPRAHEARPPYVAPAVRLRARAVADGARMLAIELAVAGATREAIAAQLQQRFGVSDPEEILDGVLMPSGTRDA